MFNTSFCAVPAFMRELPVTNSGPTTTTTGNCAVNASGLPSLHVMQPVRIFFHCIFRVLQSHKAWYQKRRCRLPCHWY
jgi:hypothetical protein